MPIWKQAPKRLRHWYAGGTGRRTLQHVGHLKTRHDKNFADYPKARAAGRRNHTLGTIKTINYRKPLGSSVRLSAKCTLLITFSTLVAGKIHPGLLPVILSCSPAWWRLPQAQAPDVRHRDADCRRHGGQRRSSLIIPIWPQ